MKSKFGRGNVFRDLGFDDAEERLVKARLASQVALLIERSGMTQSVAATVLEIDQPKVSALLRGKLDSFSTERLIRFLTKMGRDVEIVVAPRRSRGRPGRLSVRAEAG